MTIALCWLAFLVLFCVFWKAWQDAQEPPE